jgi:hypothetical protein
MSLFRKLLSSIFQTYVCYLYENILTRRNEADFLPGIRNICFIIVRTKQQFDDLIMAGYDLSDYDSETWSLLEKGVLAGLLFIEKDLASVEWIAQNPQANSAINIYPLKIDFSLREAYAAGVWTNPKYRRKGLHTYVYYKIYDFLRESGKTRVLSIVASDNIPANRAHFKFAPDERIYARARYIQLFNLRFWKESPLTQEMSKNIFDKVDNRPEYETTFFQK